MATVVQEHLSEETAFLKQEVFSQEANDDVFEDAESCKTTVIPPSSSPPSLDPLADTYRVKIKLCTSKVL